MTVTRCPSSPRAAPAAAARLVLPVRTQGDCDKTFRDLPSPKGP
jgi:hypothetical protein